MRILEVEEIKPVPYAAFRAGSAQCRQVSTAGPRNVVDAIVAETRALDGA